MQNRGTYAKARVNMQRRKYIYFLNLYLNRGQPGGDP
jgi:hypothetical protein